MSSMVRRAPLRLRLTHHAAVIASCSTAELRRYQLLHDKKNYSLEMTIILDNNCGYFNDGENISIRPIQL